MEQTASISSLSFHVAPLLPMEWLIALALCGMFLAAISGQQRKRGTFARVICFTAFLLALMNPSLLKEERNFANDTATIVVDQSASQSFGKRSERTQRALESVEKQLREQKNLDVQVITAPDSATLDWRGRRPSAQSGSGAPEPAVLGPWPAAEDRRCR